MVRNYIRKSKRQEWSLENLKRAVDAVIKKEMGLKKASAQFNVPKTTIRSYVQKKLKDDNVELKKSLGYYVPVFSSAQETEFVEYLQEMEARLFGLTMINCRHLAFQLAEKNNLVHPFNKDIQMAGEDWMKSFLSRHPELTLRKPEATSGVRAMGFNRPNVNRFFDLLKDIVDKHKLTQDRIYNSDETGISVNPKGHSKIIATRGKRQVGALTSADRGENVTVELCFSAAGAYMPPMLIFPRVRMQKEFEVGLPPGSWAEVYQTGWMTSDLFFKWFQNFVAFSKATKDNPVLLILDGHSTHTKNMTLIDYARDNGVIILCLPPHTSHRLQPLDIALMKPLSGYYEEETRKWLRTNPGKVITLWQIASLFGSAYINAANMRTALRGFEKTGIWPVNPGVFKDEDFLPSATTDRPIVIDDQTQAEPIPVQIATPSTPVTTASVAVSHPSSGPEQMDDSWNQPSCSAWNTDIIIRPNSSENSTTVLAGTPRVVSLMSTRFPSVSPKDITAVPQVEAKQKRKTNRKKGKATILTASPHKLELQTSIDEANKKKREKEERAKKKLKFNNDKKSLTTQRKTKVPNKKKKTNKEKQVSSSDASDTEGNTECLYCNELYCDSVEGWIVCQKCLNWAHNSCAGVESDDEDAFLICEFCR